MKKYVKILSVIALSLTLFTGCENFLSGGSLKEELQDILDYQYADYISIILDLNNSEGTAKTSMDMKKKPTDVFSIGFVPNREYAFLDWQISYEKEENKLRTAMASDFISGNEDLNEIFETITVTEDDSGIYSISVKIKKTAVIKKITVKPLLSKRPGVKTSSPAYDPNSTSRQTNIVVQFTQQIQEDSFRFTTAELEALGVIVQNETPDEEGNFTYSDSSNYVTYKDEDGKYYAYKSTADSFTYLKNIEITTDQGIKSVAESFEPPVLENFEDHSILTITPYSLPEKLIEIGNADYKTIIVKLAKQIKNTDGIEFADDYSWGYQVNEETPQKARIKFECNKEEGTLDSSLPVDVTKYNMSQRISLGFTEDPDYQFLRWDFDEKYVTIPDFKKVNATVLVIKETPEGETTSIKAVCAPRLRLDEENIITGTKLKDGSDAVYRNSSLQLAFSQGLPQDEAGKNQLDNINITVGGTSVAQCFMAPEFINEKTVQFVSDRNNRLDVPDGQTKTVTVSVPADLYYEYEYKEEKYKVTLGKEKSFSYIVSYETDDNAEVTFGVVSTSAGTITPSGQKSYAIGKKVAIKFEANEGWIFNGWKISSADEEMNSKIKIAAPSSEETELEIFDEIKGVIITADCTEMLNIESWSLTDTASDSDGSAEKPAVKDTGIKINFNKPLDAANKLNEIKIFADGNDCSSMYSKSLSEDKKTVTVTNTKRLSVEKGTTKTVTVSVPKSFYCTENGKKITMYQDASYSYAVNYRTTEKAKITFSIINGETGEAFETDAVPGTLEPLSYNEYYLDETIGISLAENAGYQFYRWDCDSSAITLTGKSSQSELKVNGAAVTSVKAVVYARPSVTGIKVNGTELGETVSADPFDKDSEIVINLAHEIEADAAKKITVTYTGDNFSQKDYFNTVYDRNSKTVTLKPVKILSLRNGYDNETVTVTVPADIYYIHKYKDTERTTILASGGEGISRSYKIRNATKNKTQVTYNYGSGSLSSNGNTLSSGSNSSYSIDDSISLGFTASADSVFTGWKVSCAAGTSYTVSKTDYATSGTVTVKDGSGNLYFTLQIDSQNPSKATAKVNGYVSTGITVSAGERLVAKVNDSGFTPAYVSAGVNCDTPVIIPFNKAMNASTVTLYNAQTNTGSIQIVNRESTGTHYEQYYEITAEGWSGNTLTISPKANVFEILGGAKTADIKVILNASAIKDADGKALEGVTEYSYRLNPTTNNKTKIKFVINGCTVKVDGVEINDGFFEEYSIGTKLEIECIPDESHKFISWSTGGISEDYVTVADDESSKTTLTLNKKGLSEITVTPQKILLPMMEASAVQPAYNAMGVYSDSKIVIPFNKEIDKTTVSLTSGSIQIVNKDNENTHYEQYYEIAENSWNGNTLTITPKVNVYEIFGTASIADIKVILGSGIKDKETDKNSLTGTTSFTYRINSTTSTKTKIQFIVGSTNCSVSLNGSEYSSNQTVEYNVGEKIEVQFIPNDGYKYSTYSITNNSSGAVTVDDLSSGKYELKVTKATSDIITLTPSAILLPKVNETGITPVLKTTGVECDTAIVIPFNKAIKNTTVRLYDKVTNTGSIQIVDAGNANTHYEEYFKSILTWSNGNKTLTITPEDNVYKILENSSTADIKVILGSGITDTETSPNALTETSFTYRINKTTNKKVTVNFSFSNASIKVNGESIISGKTYQCSIGDVLELECVSVSEGYKFLWWSQNCSGYGKDEGQKYLTKSSIHYTEINDYTNVKSTFKIIKDTVNVIQISMNNKEVPYVKENESSPSYSTDGVSMDTPIVLTFNKQMKTGQFILGTDINIKDENGGTLNNYFMAPTLSADGKTLTIRPNCSTITTLFTDKSTRILKINLANRIRDNSSDNSNNGWTLNELYGNGGYTKTVCYNNTRLDTIPVVSKISFKNNENGTQFDEGAIKTEEESINNHASSSVWIECEVTDTGSGVKDLIIEEYLLNNKDGEISNFSAINNVNTTMTFANNIYSSKFRYDFKSSEDGLVKLVVKAVNYAGNQTEHPLTFYFTKDCIVDCENYYLTNSNGITCFASKSTNNYSTMTNLKTKTNTMSFHYLQDRWTSRTGREYKQFPDIVLKTSQDKSLWTNVTPSNYTEETTAPYDRHYDFTIDNDVKYIKAIITDTVGNTKETVYQLPETEVSKTSLISGGIRFVLDTADVDMDPIIAKQTNYLLRSPAQSTDTLVTSDTSAFYHNANATAGNNITLTTNYLTVDKYYTIYSVSCYEYYDASGNKQYIYGHPAGYSSTVRLPSTYSYSKGSSSTYIPRFNTSLAVGPRNSNSYELSVTITNKANLADNGKYQFIVLINDTYDSTKNFVSSYVPRVYYFDNGTSITIPMDYSLRNEHYVNVVALNQETGLYYQATPVCVRTDKDVVTPQLLNFTGLSGNGSCMFTSDYSEIKFYVTEDYGPNAGYLMDEDGNVFVDYWLVPYKKEWGTLNLDTIFTTEYIENLTFPTYHTSFNWNNFEWDFNDCECRTLNIPLQGIPYGKYVLVTKVYDKNGNFKCSADGILQTADIQCHYESLETEYNEGTGIDVNLGDDGDFIIRWGAFDKVNRKWIEDENYMDSHDYTVVMHSTGSHSTSARIDTNGLGEGIDFIRFTIAHHDSNSRNVQYIGPYYVLLGSDVSDYLKDIDYFDNTRASIYCSEPCIVETLMSTENYSSVEEWNTHAMRASPKQFDASGMYTIDTSKASAGEYYCVMAHFADGTNKMTEVRQK